MEHAEAERTLTEVIQLDPESGAAYNARALARWLLHKNPESLADADKAVRRLKAQQAFMPPVDCWFVPDARWLEIREAIADKIESLEKSK